MELAISLSWHSVAVFFVNQAAKPKEKSKLHAHFIGRNLLYLKNKDKHSFLKNRSGRKRLKTPKMAADPSTTQRLRRLRKKKLQSCGDEPAGLRFFKKHFLLCHK
jgi:hypothetical protein